MGSTHRSRSSLIVVAIHILIPPFYGETAICVCTLPVNVDKSGIITYKWRQNAEKHNKTEKKALYMNPASFVNELTPRAAQVIALARKIATSFNHNFVGTEHIMLGIVRLGDESSAAQILKALGVNLAEIKTKTENLLKQGPEEMKGTETPPLTPRNKKVLSLADKERQALGQTYLGTEHILLGLLREDGGVAAQVLRELNVNIEKARAETLKLAHPLPTATTETPREPNLPELCKVAEELLMNPSLELHCPPRVFAALCAVNHIKNDNEREIVFLNVLMHLRENA